MRFGPFRCVPVHSCYYTHRLKDIASYKFTKIRRDYGDTCVFTECYKCLDDPEQIMTYHCLRESGCCTIPKV